MRQALQLTHVCVSFGTQRAVDDVSLQVEKGEFLALLGPSGCGKTTLLRAIAGLEDVKSGEIRIAERLVASSIQGQNDSPQERGVGFVFQDLGLWPHMTVMEHLLFVLADMFDKKTALDLAESQLVALKIDHLAKKKPNQLSGGESQRLALARSLVTKPRVLLMDEPLASLDPEVSGEIRRLLREIKAGSETTMIYVTHTRTEAMELGDRIALMRDGKIEQISKPEELYAHPTSAFAATFLGNCNVISGTRDENRRILKTNLGDFDLTEAAEKLKHPCLILRDFQITLGDMGVEAEVLSATFCGGDYQLEVKLEGQVILVRSSKRPAIGDRVHLQSKGEPWFVEGEIA